MTYRVLLTDNIDPDGVAVLAAEPELTVDTVPTLPREELLARITSRVTLVALRATKAS